MPASDDELFPAHVACLALSDPGSDKPWTPTRLRVWRHRHPDVLPVVARGKRGVALFRWGDVRHAVTVVVAEREAG